MTDWAGFWLGLSLMLIMFSGEPDLADALVHYLGLEPTVDGPLIQKEDTP